MDHLRGIIGTFEVSKSETVIIALKHGSIDVICDEGHESLSRSNSSPCFPRWVKPGEGPSQMDKHLRGECRPCLFLRARPTGVAKGMRVNIAISALQPRPARN